MTGWKKGILMLMLAALLCPLFGYATEVEDTLPADAVGVYEMPVLPGNWSPLSDQTPQKQFLLEMTSDRLYRVDSDGGVQPAMAQALPVDVTAQYAGNVDFGIPTQARRGYVFQLELNPGVCWENGEAVTAQDWVFTLTQYWRAGKLDLALGWVTTSDQSEQAQTPVSLREAGFSTLSQAQEAGFTDFFVDVGTFWGLSCGWKSVDDRTRLRDYAIPSGLDEYYVTPAYLYETYLAPGRGYERWQADLLGVQMQTATESVENPGILQTEDGKILLLLNQPTTATAVALALTDCFPMPQSQWSDVYGSAASYLACGQYRVESAGVEQILLVRNEAWQGDWQQQQPEQIRCRPAA